MKMTTALAAQIGGACVLSMLAMIVHRLGEPYLLAWAPMWVASFCWGAVAMRLFNP
jgi:hypothetical protein